MTTRVFSVSPNWREPFLETWAHRTLVMAGEDGAEQRAALRSAKAMTWSFLATAMAEWETLWLAGLLYQGPVQSFAVPYWPDATRLTAPAAMGAASLSCSTTDRRFEANGWAVLYRSARETELVALTGSILAGSVSCVALAAAWPAGTTIIPARLGVLAETPSIVRPTSATGEVEVSFALEVADSWGVEGYGEGVPGA